MPKPRAYARSITVHVSLFLNNSPIIQKNVAKFRGVDISYSQAVLLYALAPTRDGNRKPAVHAVTVLFSAKAALFDDKTSLFDGKTTLFDGKTTLFDGKTTLFDNKTTLFDNKTSLFDGKTSLFDDKTSLFDGKTSLFDGKTSLFGDKTTLLYDKRCYLTSGQSRLTTMRHCPIASHSHAHTRNPVATAPGSDPGTMLTDARGSRNPVATAHGSDLSQISLCAFYRERLSISPVKDAGCVRFVVKLKSV
jgi:hypothetical protein